MSEAELTLLQKPSKDVRHAPPTEEERVALRAQKEQEKAAKAQAKATSGLNMTPDELKKRDQTAVGVTPNATASSSAMTSTSMPKLKLLTKGKVRDIYELPEDRDKLLFVATDRISAYDYIMENVSCPVRLCAS